MLPMGWVGIVSVSDGARAGVLCNEHGYRHLGTYRQAAGTADGDRARAASRAGRERLALTGAAVPPDLLASSRNRHARSRAALARGLALRLEIRRDPTRMQAHRARDVAT